LAGRRDRAGIRGAASRARLAPRPPRHLRARTPQAPAAETRGIRGAAEARGSRLGRRRSVVPAVLRQPVHAGRDARAATVDERAAARVLVAGGGRAPPALLL